MNNTFSNGSFRIEEIVGRRIFTESSLWKVLVCDSDNNDFSV